MLSSANSLSKILLPFNHILKSHNGDSLHRKIYLAFNYWFKLPADKVQTIIDSVDNLHHCKKLLDDIHENTSSENFAAHLLYGIALTTNAAFYMTFNSLQKIQQIDRAAQVGQVYSEQMCEVLRGRGLEILWRDSNYCPSEEEYKQMVEDKIGGMFLLAVRLMQLFSDDKNDYTKFTKLLALYFQIRNDYVQQLEALTSVAETSCDGYDMGARISLPIVHALRTPQGACIRNMLREPVKDRDVKRHFQSELERLGSFKYTRDLLLQLDLQTRSEVERLGSNPEMEYVLDELLTWSTLDRRSKSVVTIRERFNVNKMLQNNNK